MARSTFPTSARRTISQCWVPPATCAPILAVPLRQQGELIGSLNARRTEVRPFTPAQIKLLETFADQAVIAIENVRLFKELNASALEQQTATSEILGVIASSPTDIQPVLDVVAENAARLCGATMLRSVVSRVMSSDSWPHYGPCQHAVEMMSSCHCAGLLIGRAIIDRQTIHIHDLAAEVGHRISREQGTCSNASGIALCLPHRCCARE